MPMQVHLKKKQLGQTLTLSFRVEMDNSGTPITSEEINVNDLAWVRFKFSVGYSTNMTFKKHEKAKSAEVKINIFYDEFEKECIVPEDWSDEINIQKYDCFKSYVLFSLEVSVIAQNVTTRPSLINKLFEDTDFTDFQLCASDGGVAVHKSILSIYSDMFKTMLGGEWKETAEGRITIPGVTEQTLRHLKEYMYLHTLPDDGLEPLLLLAAHYLMDTLRADCIKRLLERIKPENVDGLIKLACENNLPDLMKGILRGTLQYMD